MVIVVVVVVVIVGQNLQKRSVRENWGMFYRPDPVTQPTVSNHQREL